MSSFNISQQFQLLELSEQYSRYCSKPIYQQIKEHLQNDVSNLSSLQVSYYYPQMVQYIRYHIIKIIQKYSHNQDSKSIESQINLLQSNIYQTFRICEVNVKISTFTLKIMYNQLNCQELQDTQNYMWVKFNSIFHAFKEYKQLLQYTIKQRLPYEMKNMIQPQLWQPIPTQEYFSTICSLRYLESIKNNLKNRVWPGILVIPMITAPNKCISQKTNTTSNNEHLKQSSSKNYIVKETKEITFVGKKKMIRKRNAKLDANLKEMNEEMQDLEL